MFLVLFCLHTQKRFRYVYTYWKIYLLAKCNHENSVNFVCLPRKYIQYARNTRCNIIKKGVRVLSCLCVSSLNPPSMMCVLCMYAIPVVFPQISVPSAHNSTGQLLFCCVQWVHVHLVRTLCYMCFLHTFPPKKQGGGGGWKTKY